MKILFLVRLYYPHIGGVEKHVEELSKTLTKKGHKIKIITEQYDTSLKLYEEHNRVEIYRIPQYQYIKSKKLHIWLYMWKNRNIFNDVDIIHAHDVFYWYIPFRLIYIRKPAYVTFHGYESYPLKNGAILIRKLSEILAFGNICVGDFITKWYHTKTNYITYGAANLPLNNTINDNYNKNSAIFYGRLENQTGVLSYVSAYNAIVNKINGFRLVIYGSGELKKNIPADIETYPFTDNPVSKLKNYHFAFISRYLSILEALISKRLVFAIYTDPIKEDYLRMSPFAKWIVVVGSDKEIVDKVLYFLKHPSKEKELIEGGYEWARKQTWEKVANLYLKLWKK